MVARPCMALSTVRLARSEACPARAERLVQFSIGAGTAVTAGCETGLGQAIRLGRITTTISSHGRIWGTRCDCSYNGSVPFVSGAGSLGPGNPGASLPDHISAWFSSE